MLSSGVPTRSLNRSSLGGRCRTYSWVLPDSRTLVGVRLFPFMAGESRLPPRRQQVTRLPLLSVCKCAASTGPVHAQ